MSNVFNIRPAGANDLLWWRDQAEREAARLDRPSKIECRRTPPNADGQAHMTYFDNTRELSFVWNGGQIHVSYGGYGEPTLWTFDPNLFLGSGQAQPFEWFKSICNHWIDAKEDAA